ncbi:MAG TPA: hypothetical protein DIW44_05625 [Anaerolineaceae bacterium]|nr:hypothetical protein [Anaerolineaceae bacterium]
MPEETKKRKGGQPGNHNALRHGRYIAKENIHFVHATEEDQLDTLDQLIIAVKKTMAHTYRVSLKAETTQEINQTMNSLSMAAIGLCRMLHMRDRITSPPQFPDLGDEYHELLELFKETFMTQQSPGARHP